MIGERDSNRYFNMKIQVMRKVKKIKFPTMSR